MSIDLLTILQILLVAIFYANPINWILFIPLALFLVLNFLLSRWTRTDNLFKSSNVLIDLNELINSELEEKDRFKKIGFKHPKGEIELWRKNAILSHINGRKKNKELSAEAEKEEIEKKKFATNFSKYFKKEYNL